MSKNLPMNAEKVVRKYIRSNLNWTLLKHRLNKWEYPKKSTGKYKNGERDGLWKEWWYNGNEIF